MADRSPEGIKPEHLLYRLARGAWKLPPVPWRADGNRVLDAYGEVVLEAGPEANFDTPGYDKWDSVNLCRAIALLPELLDELQSMKGERDRLRMLARAATACSGAYLCDAEEMALLNGDDHG